MCGIVGYIGYREASEVRTSGLLRLEYRGYDSFGIATLSPSLSSFKHLGKISDSAASALHLKGTVGIGHTRWATHGVPSEINAHPHLDEKKKIAVVHNGIIENYADLKRGLEQRGVVFASETDTEVIPHLIAEKYTGNLFEAVSSILPLLEGSYALLILAEGEEKMIAARHGSPLVLGIGDDEFILGSDALPLLDYTKKAVYFEEGDVAEITKNGYTMYNAGFPVSRGITELEWSLDEVKKGGFEHYMLKEIFEQPEAFANTLSSIKHCFEAMDMIKNAHFITVVACGTSANSSMVFFLSDGKHLSYPDTRGTWIRVQVLPNAKHRSGDRCFTVWRDGRYDIGPETCKKSRGADTGNNQCSGKFHYTSSFIRYLYESRP